MTGSMANNPTIPSNIPVSAVNTQWGYLAGCMIGKEKGTLLLDTSLFIPKIGTKLAH